MSFGEICGICILAARLCPSVETEVYCLVRKRDASKIPHDSKYFWKMPTTPDKLHLGVRWEINQPLSHPMRISMLSATELSDLNLHVSVLSERLLLQCCCADSNQRLSEEFHERLNSRKNCYSRPQLAEN